MKEPIDPDIAKVIMAVNLKGQLRMIYCPFRVRTREPTEFFPVGISLWVEEIRYCPYLRIQYHIGSAWYPYYSFQILSDF